MDAHPPAHRVALQDRCRAAGIAITSQLRVVYESLAGRDDHPCAEDVFHAARRRLPEIHRATVYRALDRLVDLGLASRVHRVGHAARFDPHVGPHDHAVCVRCGAMEDLEASVPTATAAPASVGLPARGFAVVGHSVQVHVVCPACRRRGPGPAAAGSPGEPRGESREPVDPTPPDAALPFDPPLDRSQP